MTQVDQSSHTTRTQPRRGDVVRVRSREEILATLDQDGAIDALPLMPEMLKYCGETLTVWARADKTCDTLEWTGNRRMMNTVHLVGARCDGSAHGGCQAGCMLFWREEWLEWPDEPGNAITPPTLESAHPVATPATLTAATRANEDPDEPVYRCQATEHFRASTAMPRHNYVQYLTDVRIRNVSTAVVIRGLLIFVFNKFQRLTRFLPDRLRVRGGHYYPFVIGTGTGERMPTLDLQPGDLVEVKSKEEIMATLGPDQRNRNMWFDAEMLPYCGRQARVVRHVRQILNENTGKMIKVGDCVVLEDAVCLGLYHRFCQRAITPYWRSGWLRKVAESPADTADTADAAGSIGDVVAAFERRR